MALLSSSPVELSVAVEALGADSEHRSNAEPDNTTFATNLNSANTSIVRRPPLPEAAIVSHTDRDEIHGASSGSVLGGSGHTIHLHNQNTHLAHPHPSGPPTTTLHTEVSVRRRDESPVETYTRILLAQRLGYPLWRPEPLPIPPAYEAEGIRIGDVGIVNERGLFEFSFNICLPADDPINSASRLPASFVPFTCSSDHVVNISNAYPPRSIVRSASVSQSRYYPQIERVSGPCPFQFYGSAPEGAIVFLPNGASQTDLASWFRPHLLAHARKHALRWLEWVYGGLEFASSIYLITGYDKCNDWCLASYSNAPASSRGTLSFLPSRHPSGLVHYEAQLSGNITGRTYQPNEHNLWNQTVFIRGYKITVRRTLQERLRKGAVKISNVVSQETEEAPMSAFGGVPGGATLLNRFSSLLNNLSGNSRSNRSDQQNTDPLDGNVLQVESIPGTPEMQHPSDIINSYMLSAHPEALFAITHDDDWRTVMYQTDDAFPDSPEFLERIQAKYIPVRHADCVSLVGKAPSSPSADHRRDLSRAVSVVVQRLDQLVINRPRLDQLMINRPRLDQLMINRHTEPDLFEPDLPRSLFVTGSGMLSRGLVTSDNVILVMGPVGAGKSTFINSAVGRVVATVGRDSSPCTTALSSHVAAPRGNSSREVYLVDTPGFNDPDGSDDQTLREIADWLTSHSEPEIELAGIIYLYDIHEAQDRKPPELDMLCRLKPQLSTVVATTKWPSEDETANGDELEQREEQLKKYCASGLPSKPLPRFLQDRTSAWEIIELVLNMQRLPLNLVTKRFLATAEQRRVDANQEQTANEVGAVRRFVSLFRKR